MSILCLKIPHKTNFIPQVLNTYDSIFSFVQQHFNSVIDSIRSSHNVDSNDMDRIVDIAVSMNDIHSTSSNTYFRTIERDAGEHTVTKEDCINHVQKRVTSMLKTIRAKFSRMESQSRSSTATGQESLELRGAAVLACLYFNRGRSGLIDYLNFVGIDANHEFVNMTIDQNEKRLEKAFVAAAREEEITERKHQIRFDSMLAEVDTEEYGSREH
ncbi:unnamed protein product [Adineta ricciae]|uniref:Uncharacterized protein n=1 Tax=Adineta ricciae TaxID=249248 RepID=A0A815SPG9_ADIRI|nr:unnamed protein product [Adineta ricciae]